jgi:hypothetical protein
MFAKKKRAVSTLVATVLLILITVAAVSVVWTSVRLMISNVVPTQACLNARLTIATTQGYTCAINGTVEKEVQVMVSRAAEEFNLAGVSLVVSGGGQSKKFTFKEGTTDALLKMKGDALMGGILTLPNANEERTYIANITGFLTKMEEIKIAPIVKVGTTEKECDVTSTVALTPCT